MPNNNIADLLQQILTRLAQFEATTERRLSNMQQDIQGLKKHFDDIREGQAMQAGEIEATQQQTAMNKKKLGDSSMRSLVNGGRF